jgi:hypothetical protein
LNTKTYTDLLANPQQFNSGNLEELAAVIEKYPYFQSARALQLKGLHNTESYLYNDALRKTAAYTADRDVLFDYITSESFSQNEISKNIQQQETQVSELEVVSEDLSEEVSIEIDKQIKAELKKAEAILNPELFRRKLDSVKEISEPQTQTAAEEILKPNQPLAFKKEDTHSFSEWLKLTKAAPIDRSMPSEGKSSKDKIPEDKNDKDKKFELIDRFIQKRPRLEPAKTEAGQKDLSEPFIQTPEALMTETLAKVYVQQKNYDKALQAYKILILKYPEKSGFFADQIRAIKKLNTK